MINNRSLWGAKCLMFFILIFICPFYATAKAVVPLENSEHLPGWWNELEPQWKKFFLDIIKRERTSEHEIHSIETLHLLTKLDTLPEGVDNLEGLRYLESLRSIAYSYNEKKHSLKSLKGIEKLPRLKSVSITNAMISDFGILSSAENLGFLNLSSCEIISIACVDLPRLQQLSLAENKISDITNIACYTGLKTLNFRRLTS